MSAVLVYFICGGVWTTGVFVARFFDGFVHYPRAWVWIPLTLLAWPVSTGIALVEFIEGYREGQSK